MQLKELKNSKNAKILAANFTYLSILQVVGYVFPIITIPYLSRVIGVIGFGKLGFASAVIVWFNTFAEWGFNYTATRDVVRCRDNDDEVSRIFSNVLWARTLLMLVAFVVLVFSIALVPIFRQNASVLLVTFLMIPGSIIFPTWFFQALERMKYITIFETVNKLLFTLLVFVFIKKESDYIIQPLLTSIAYVISGIASLYIIIKRWGYTIIWTGWQEIISTIRKSTDVFLNNLFPNLYNSFSRILLGFWGGSYANGIFDAGNKFVQVAQRFLDVLSRTFYPFLSRRIDKHALYEMMSLIISTSISLILFFSSKYIISLFYTPDFSEAVGVMKILAISIIFLSMNDIYGKNYLILRGYEKSLRKITMFASLVGFVISFSLISKFTFVGAAITITVSRGVLGLGSMLYAHRVKSTIEGV